MVMTREDFAKMLSPIQLEFILASIRGGLALYSDDSNYSAAARLDHNPSTRAAIRNGHIIGYAKRRLLECPEAGIRLVIKGNRPLFYFNERARLSFKKLNENRRHSNYPTRQAKAFDAQLWPVEAVGDLSNRGATNGRLWPENIVPSMTNVIGGYMSNQAETSFEVFIICPDGEGNQWEWPLSDTEIEELIKSPEPAATEVANKIRKRRVRVRSGAIRKSGNDGYGQ